MCVYPILAICIEIFALFFFFAGSLLFLPLLNSVVVSSESVSFLVPPPLPTIRLAFLCADN